MINAYKIKTSIFIGLFVVLLYLTLLPSNSIYLNTTMRIIAYVGVFILFCLGYRERILHNNKYLYLYIFGFILINCISLLTTQQFLKQDYQYVLDVGLIYFFCSVPRLIQRQIFNKFITLGSILLIFALFEFILWNYFSTGFLLKEHIERGEGSTQYYSHGILNIYQEGELIIRFQALLREPGFLGVIAGLIMFATIPINKYVRAIWFISGCFSFSLAFYILASIAFFYHIFVSKTLLNWKYIIGGLVLISILSMCAYEIFNDAILERIIMYSEDGDNRTTKDLNLDLISMTDSGEIFIGRGYINFEKNYGFGNAGIKAELYKYGIVNLFLFIVFFIKLLEVYKYSLIDRLTIIVLFILCLYNADCKYSPYIYIILLSLFYEKNECTTHCNANHGQICSCIE